MKLAEKFNLPVITLIDTPGAYPGVDAEEKGQSEAIAYNLATMSRLEVPILAVVIGEGGSGMTVILLRVMLAGRTLPLFDTRKIFFLIIYFFNLNIARC